VSGGRLLLVAAASVAAWGAAVADIGAARPFERFLSEAEPSCFVLLDPRTGESTRSDDERCAERLPPCSTFKVPNSLIGLETGVIPDAEFVVPWDGRARSRAVLNRDHSLRTALAESVVWYYQELARRVGMERMQRHVSSIPYGNEDLSGGLTEFWLGSSLRISADEQVEFLRRLTAGDLPFSDRSMRIVRDLTVLERGDGWVLHGKTGSCRLEGGRSLGWFVGWIERGSETRVFACNVEGSGLWGGDARRITAEILRESGLIPGPGGEPGSTR
jgi:beta-lactamase class D